MKRIKRSLCSLLLVALVCMQSVPAYAYEAIGDAVYDVVAQEEVSEVTSEGVSSEVTSEDATEENTEAPSEEGSEESTEAPSEESSEETTEAPSEEGSEESTEAPSEENSEESTEASSEEGSEESTEASSEENSEESTEESSEETKPEGEVCDPAIRPEGDDFNAVGTKDDITTGNLSVKVTGSYHTETATKILSRLNEIRKEACDNGYKNPATGKALKSSDYTPLKWSADLEAIARLRAAEAGIYMSHNRPNGEECWTVVSDNNVKSYAESLAWNFDGLMTGIEQWYDEKDDWVNQNSKAETGHYEMIISTTYNSVGVGCFYSKDKGYSYPYTVVMELNGVEKPDTTKDNTVGSCTVPIEFKGSYVTAIGIAEDDIPFITVDESGDVVCKATLSFKNPGGSNKITFTKPVDMGLTWSSSDTDVSTITVSGRVTGKKVGKTTIKAEFKTFSTSRELEVYAKGTSPLVINNLAKTTYLVGEKLDVTNATVKNRRTKKSAKLTDSSVNLSGFNNSKDGVIAVTVKYDGETTTFDTLVVSVPNTQGMYGTKLKNIAFPNHTYGTYVWVTDSETELDKVGENTYLSGFTPFDTKKFSIRADIKTTVKVYRTFDSSWVSFPEKEYPYTGGEQSPAPIIVSEGDCVALKEGKDYSVVSYADNIDVGTASITIKPMGYYLGANSVANFEICKATVTITPEDLTLCKGELIPEWEDFAYECTGLAEGDSLITPPEIRTSAEHTLNTGIFEITASGADAGSNYDIVYNKGVLRIVDAPISYDVTFDNCGIGEEISPMIGVEAGTVISKPADPVAEGYVFTGWYKDAAYKKAWDFAKDVISADTTLYASWVKERTGTSFYVQAIPDMTYTSKAVKPTVAVYDGDMLLKSGKDYTLTYKNNVNANAGNVKAQDGTVDYSLPYVIIKGKGNYTSEIIVNFNIIPASLGDGTPVNGVSVKYQDQMAENEKKTINPLTSLKFLKAMKKGTDYTVTLTTYQAYSEKGLPVAEGTVCENGLVPKGYSGSFLLRVDGIGNYTGYFAKLVKVADKAHMLKNFSIVLGKNIKTPVYTGEKITFVPGYYDQKANVYYQVINGGLEDKYHQKKTVIPENVYLVKYGKTYLMQDRDFTVSYTNNKAVGTATMTITGKGEYIGSKSITFKITGIPFSGKNITVDGLADCDYTGEYITLDSDKVKLTYLKGQTGARTLQPGKDYTVSYKNNLKKGKATVTFTGLASGGFTGKFTKTFKINGIDISNSAQVKYADSMKNISINYSKAKPNLVLYTYLRHGDKVLEPGTDYTISYKNYNKVADKNADKAPTFILKGKGNYTGTLTFTYSIVKDTFEESHVYAEVTPVAFNAKKADTYLYKASVKVKQGKNALKNKSEYTVEYINATQADIKAYYAKLDSGTATEADKPKVKITATETSPYSGSITADIPVYRTKLASANVYVLVDTSTTEYTGSQVKPKVTVFYSTDKTAVKKAKKYTDPEMIKGYGLTELEEGVDYYLTYGANLKAGKNTGSVIVNGKAYEFGSKVTQKFTITKKELH